MGALQIAFDTDAGQDGLKHDPDERAETILVSREGDALRRVANHGPSCSKGKKPVSHCTCNWTTN